MKKTILAVVLVLLPITSFAATPVSWFRATGGGSIYQLYLTDKVGIGTANPQTTIDVQGNASSTRYFANDGGASSPAYSFAGAQTTGWYRSGTSVSLSISGTDALLFTRSGTNGQVLGVSGNSVTLNSAANGGHIVLAPTATGNVGIGTTSPASPLWIENSGATPLTLYRPSAASNVGLEFKNNDASWYIGRASNGGFSISNSNNLLAGSMLMLASNGNVGIATTTPSEKLYVGGGTGHNYIALDGGNSASQDGGAYAVKNGSVDKGLFGNVSAIHGGAYNGNMEVYSVGSFQINAGGAAAASPSLMVTSAGNVGIGTASPGQKLHVQGNIVVPFDAGGSGAGKVGIGSSDGATMLGYLSENAATTFLTNNEGGGSISLVTGGLTRFTVANGGNVGIGSTTPFAKLSIAMASTTPAFVAGVAGSSTPSLYVGSANSNGYVGFGTASPGNPVDIATPVYTSLTNKVAINIYDGIVGSNPSGIGFANGRGYVGQSNSTALLEGGSGKGFALAVNANSGFGSGTVLLTGTSGGNIGIGSTTPAQILSVQGNALVSGNLSVAGITATSTVSTQTTFRMKGYTVSTLPAGVQGDIAFVTDALAPSFLTIIVGGGTTVTPVFYNGTNWIAQ